MRNETRDGSPTGEHRCGRRGESTGRERRRLFEIKQRYTRGTGVGVGQQERHRMITERRDSRRNQG
jgi:hypothetical protein